MIEIKDYLTIPDGYFLEVGPVKRNGVGSHILYQDVTCYRKEVRRVTTGIFNKKHLNVVEHVEIFTEPIFVDECGRLSHGCDIGLDRIRERFHPILRPASSIPPAVRTGRHP